MAQSNGESPEGHPPSLLSVRSPFIGAGELIGPVDEITADVDNVVSPPAYHDLGNAYLMKYDVKEWAGKIRKYKLEVIHHVERIRTLKKEVDSLRSTFDAESGMFEKLDHDIIEETNKREELYHVLDEEAHKRLELQSEINQLKHHKDNLQTTQRQIEVQMSQITNRIGMLKTEIEGNQQRYQHALGEKEKLALERDWFCRERVLLEETTEREAKHIEDLKEELDKLRYVIHQNWFESKRLDVLGHLRATKIGPTHEEWYLARRRTFTRVRSDGGHLRYSLSKAE